MVSYKHLFLIKGVTCWNGLTEWVGYAKKRAYSVYQSIAQWFHSDYHTWYLYKDSLFPVSYRDYYGLETAEWKYSTKNHELVYLSSPVTSEYRIGWLSARITTATEEKEMDTFLSGLRIRTMEGLAPPSRVFLQAWSLYDKQWWSADRSARLEWIDAVAEEGIATVAKLPVLPLVLCQPLRTDDPKKKN